MTAPNLRVLSLGGGWLDVLAEDHGVMPLFTDEGMDCDAGVCFT